MAARYQIGIDWGTHSSKICVADHKGKYLPPVLMSSDLLRDGERLVFSPKVSSAQDKDNFVRRLKGDLIQHIGRIQFWGRDDRPDSGTSLGEAVVFSLVCLLAEGNRMLAKMKALDGLDQTEVGFSFPNWLAEESRQASEAAQSFCDAVKAAIHIVSAHPMDELPTPGKAFSIHTLKEWTSSARGATQLDQDRPLSIEEANTRTFRFGTAGPEWRFIVESGAAGLPYLRAMKINNRPGVAGLAKLLVIDVGAGSTDVGYMLKTSNVKTGAPTFYYFHPASTFAEAGNALTEELRKHYRAQNRPISWAEAEAQKVSRSAWHKLPFVQLWIRHICDHVAQYMAGVPDQRWLPFPVELQVVVTGGSGLVPGLKDELHTAVTKALEGRGFHRQTCEAVRVVDKYEPRFNLESEAEVARMAVCFGAADPDKPGFRYTAKMDPPTRTPVRFKGPGWV